MTQIFKVTIGGNDVTTHIKSATVNESINVLYHTATLEAGIDFISEQNIVMQYGDKTFTGFVFSSSKQSESLYRIECRTNGAKMTEPYCSFGDYKIEDATTSYALCDLYALEFGVPIVNTAQDLNFGGNYERRGTPLSALSTIANVTGAEYWYDGTSIVISPNKAIGEDGTVIKKSDIFSFVPQFETISQRGIGIVHVGVTDTQSSYTTSVKCGVEIDRCSGEVMARVVPHDSMESTKGIELYAVQTPLVFQSVLSATYSVTLDAHISSISKVMINGIEVLDYVYEYDTVVFQSEKRGIVLIEYVGYGWRGYANIVTVGIDRYSQFDIYYGSCDVYRFQDKMECADSNNYSLCGGVFTIFTSENNYAKGFNFKTIGGTPTLSFFTDTTNINVTPVTTAETLQWVEHATLSIESDGSIRHKLRFSATSITEVRANGEDITANTSYDGEFIIFDKVYLGVIISYQVAALNHFIKFQNYPDQNVRMLVSGDVTGECTYNLVGYNQDSTSSTSCVEGVTVPINMMTELGATAGEASYKSVSVTDPLGNITTLTTDAFGVLKIPNVIFGKYSIDVNNIQRNSTMTLRAGG